MIKVYINNCPFNLSTSVKGKGDNSYLVDFTGYSNGRGREANRSEFTTDNKELQEAIEADPRYGKMFTCISHENANNSSDDLEQETPLTTSEGVAESDGDEGVAKVAGVTNTQMAIEWLAQNKEHTFSARPSKADVLSIATSLGVVFTDWK